MLRCCAGIRFLPRMYQLATSSWPSGLAWHAQHDDVVEEAHGFGVGAAHHLVDHLHELLRADVSLACRPPSIHTTALPSRGQLARLLVGEAFGQRQPAGDLLILVQVLDVFRRGDDGHVLAPALGVWPMLTSFMRSDSVASFFH